MTLNLDKLKQSISSLEGAIKVTETASDSPDSMLKETLRSGVIQNFEIAYEQCWKMIQR